jgi:hypothetical protein
MTDSPWSTLSKFDVSAQVEQKNKFDYLSWAWAWAYVKEKYPNANFEKHIFRDNQDNPLPFMRDTKGHTYVAVTVTIEGLSHTEIMPVLDFKNKSVPHPDGFEVNKAHQRCLVKAIAFHGLGLNLYAGEDLPLDLDDDTDDIIRDFRAATTIDDIDTAWRSHATSIGKLSKSSKQQVTDEFKNAKASLKASAEESA